MLGNRSGSQCQLLGFEDLGILRCFVLFLFLLWEIGLGLYFSFSLSLSLSLFLSPFIAFVVDIILTVIVEYFWNLHCLVVCCVTFVYSFWSCSCVYFYFCISGATILTVIMKYFCWYLHCLSGSMCSLCRIVCFLICLFVY